MESAPEPALTSGLQSDSSASEREVEDVERHQLIIRILKAYKDHGFHRTLSPVSFAAVWLANIDCLRGLVGSLETNFHAVCYELNCAPEVVSCWTSKSVPPTLRLPGLELCRRKIQQSKRTVEMCHQRDQKCVVTKATDPTISAQAVPYSFNKLDQDASNEFWLFLETFWGEDQTKKWREFIQTKTTESVENQMLLSPTAHTYWDEWLFALEPVLVSTDKKKLFMRFHWLCPGNLDSLQMTTQALIDPDFVISHPTFRPVDLSRGGRDKSDTSIPNLRLLDCDSCMILESGDLITVSTDDPESLPLPSFEILHLQWILHRVRALATAGVDEFLDDDYGLCEEPDKILRM